MLDFQRYVDEFNSGNDADLVDRWYTPDFEYVGSNRTIVGIDNWRDFLLFAHRGLREIYRPQTIVQNTTHIFCEHDMDFYALVPRPEFPFGPLLPGDMYTVKFFGLYQIAGDRFSRLTISTWPVNANVSVLPRLGAHATQRAAFQSFVAALAGNDRDRAGKLVAKDAPLVDAAGARQPGSAIDFLGELAELGTLSGGLNDFVAEDTQILVPAAGITLRLNNGIIEQVSMNLQRGSQANIPMNTTDHASRA